MTTDTRTTLEDLGQGFDWHLDVHEAARARIAPARDALAEGGVPAGTSPLMPESAAALIDDLQRRVGSEPIVITSQDAGLLAAAGAGGSAIEWPLHSGAAVMPVPPEHQGAHGALVLDLLAHPGAFVRALCRALAGLREGGTLSVVLHPLDRPVLEACLPLTPARLVEKRSENIARLMRGIGGTPVVADILWDVWVCERTEGKLSVAPDKECSNEAAEQMDVDDTRHCCFEVHGLAPKTTAKALDNAMREMQSVVSRKGSAQSADAKGYLHRYATQLDGGYVVVTVDISGRFAAVQLTPWTPRTHLLACEALLAHLPRAQTEIRFSPPAPQ